MIKIEKSKMLPKKAQNRKNRKVTKTRGKRVQLDKKQAESENNNAEKKREEKICGKCNKPKGKNEGCCMCGRPVKYKDEFCRKILDYFSKESHIIAIKRLYYDPKGKPPITEVEGRLYGAVKQEDAKILANIFPTLHRFADSIGVHRDTLVEWSKEKYPENYAIKAKRGKLKYPEFSDAYKRAKQTQEAIFIENSLVGIFVPGFSTFFAKTYLGRDEGDKNKDDKKDDTLSKEKSEKVNKLLELNG